MITYIQGDLFAANPKIIVHGCNAQGVMGSGFAKRIKELYPDCVVQYSKFCQNWLNVNRNGPIGQCHTWQAPNGGPLIINAITQSEYGFGSIKYCDYDAIDNTIESIANFIPTDQVISMPKIGSGLGGGNWGVIEAIIKHRLRQHEVHIYEL